MTTAIAAFGVPSIFGGGFCLVCDEPSWYLDQGEFHIVALNRVGDSVHSRVQGDAVLDELRQTGFSVDLVDGHVVGEGLV